MLWSHLSLSIIYSAYLKRFSVRLSYTGLCLALAVVVQIDVSSRNISNYYLNIIIKICSSKTDSRFHKSKHIVVLLILEMTFFKVRNICAFDYIPRLLNSLNVETLHFPVILLFTIFSCYLNIDNTFPCKAERWLHFHVVKLAVVWSKNFAS